MANRILPFSQRVDVVGRFIVYEDWKRKLPWETTDYLDFCEAAFTTRVPNVGTRAAKELLLQVILFVHEFDRRHNRMEE